MGKKLRLAGILMNIGLLAAGAGIAGKSLSESIPRKEIEDDKIVLKIPSRDEAEKYQKMFSAGSFTAVGEGILFIFSMMYYAHSITRNDYSQELRQNRMARADEVRYDLTNKDWVRARK